MISLREHQTANQRPCKLHLAPGIRKRDDFVALQANGRSARPRRRSYQPAAVGQYHQNLRPRLAWMSPTYQLIRRKFTLRRARGGDWTLNAKHNPPINPN